MCVQYHNKHNDQHYHNSMSFAVSFCLYSSLFFSCYSPTTLFALGLSAKKSEREKSPTQNTMMIKFYARTPSHGHRKRNTHTKSEKNTLLFPFVLIDFVNATAKKK